MELLRNPKLGEMSTDDLNQRYADTHCIYFGEPQYIYQFSRGDGGDILIDHAIINTGNKVVNPTRAPFRWEGLNVARPQAGWYSFSYGENSYPFHISYPTKKQYKRGLCAKNTSIYVPAIRAPGMGQYFLSVLSRRFLDQRKIVDDDLLEKGTVIPRPDRVLTHYDGVWNFFFHTRHVAQINLENNKMVVMEPKFLQELWEVCDSPLIRGLERQTYIPAVKLKPKNAIADELKGRGFNIDAILRERAQWDEVANNALRPEEDEFERDHIEFVHPRDENGNILLELYSADDMNHALPIIKANLEAVLIAHEQADPNLVPRYQRFGTVQFRGWPDDREAEEGGLYIRKSARGDIQAWKNAGRLCLGTFRAYTLDSDYACGLFTSNNQDDAENIYLLYEARG